MSRARGTAVTGLLAVAALVAGCTASPSASSAGSDGSASSDTGATSTTSSAPPMPLALSMTPSDKAAGVAPGEPVTVAATGGQLGQVTLAGADGKPIAGQLAEGATSWQSSQPLAYGKTYTLTASGQGTDGKAVTATSTFTTAKAKRQVSLSVSPLDGSKVGVGQPLAFYFDGAVANKPAVEKAIKITSTPSVEGAFYWFSDKEVHWRPKAYWPSGTKITINAAVYGKDFGNGVYGAKDRTINVTVGDAVVSVADGTTEQMTVTINGTLARTIPISMGKKGHETPIGTYVVMGEYQDYTMDSSTYGVPIDSPAGYRVKIAYASRLSGSGVFYHSAPWSVADQGHRNVSHGCLNMSVENAKWMQSIANPGDPVTVLNSGGPQLEAWDGLGDWQIPWATWSAGGKRQ